MNATFKKGFTLVELLIVIGILAVLATTAVVILNPAQLLAQARDSQRLSDLGSINSALALYMTDRSSPDLNGALADTPGCDAVGSATAGRAYVTIAPTTDSFTRTTDAVDAARESDGSGWLPVNFASISGGSPLPILPVDPTNEAGDFIYRYACDMTNKTYEINACLESNKYKPHMGTDGGNKPASGATTETNVCSEGHFYEVGTDPGLNL